MASSRRDFLKTSGLAALAASVPEPKAQAQATASHSSRSTDRHAGSAQARGRAALVNVLQGTNSNHSFSRGNTLPIVAMPFGMAHWTLQSRSDSGPWFFQPADQRIEGIRCTHQLSPWLSDYGQAVFLPFRGDPNPEPGARAASYRPEDTEVLPHALRLRLERYRMDLELIPSERCAVVQAKFDETGPIGFLLDVPGKTENMQADKDSRRISFRSTANEGGVPENFATYYVVEFDRPWQNFEQHDLRRGRAGMARFAEGDALQARIATSFISFEQAERNLRLELGSKPLAALKDAAKARWNEHLSRIEIEDATAEQQKTFYSCLYRALLFPRIWHEPDAQGKMQHFSAFNGKVVPGVMYADHGYWDVYRAWYPFMALLFPERLGEILQGWVNAFHEGGWMPQFPAPGYRACMSGSLIDAVFADAVVKKVEGFDMEAAYEGLHKHATQKGDPDKGYGRQGIEYYLQMNYLPADHVGQSVAETADAAYGDFCISQVARALGKQDDAAQFLKRSQNWKNIFDPKTGFLRGKNQNGTWLEPFDPFTWGSPYEEGGAWQHRWDVPHDVAGLIAALGGEERAAAALEKMLTLPPHFNVGVYGQEIHEMSEMAALPFGQYSHNNQPVHHVLYLFAAAGRPDRTQYWVRRVLNEAYSPAGFSGDEDTGSMSAWYILSAMGFYPVCPGKPEYTLGSPLFSRVTVHLEKGKNLVIEARGQSPEAVYVSGVRMNGNAVTGTTIAHDALAHGGTLSFQMQAAPKTPLRRS